MFKKFKFISGGKITKMQHFLKDVDSEWMIEQQENEAVKCHTRIVGGVLCRWWGDGPAPSGVNLIDKAIEFGLKKL